MIKEKRKARAYKIADTPYKKALKKQTNPPLATFIEAMVTAIGDGQSVIITPKQSKK